MFKWKDDYMLDIKELDDQHKYFHSALNQLHEKVIRSAPHNEIDEIIKDVIAYAEDHFSTEEKYFEKFQWDGRFEHIEKHNELRERLGKLYKRFRKGEDIGVEIVTFLIEWLTLHLATEDKNYVECFKKNGLK